MVNLLKLITKNIINNMSTLNVELAINKLSFGNVSINILLELFKLGQKVCIFPIGPVDISSFDKLTEEFKVWLQDGINRALLDYSANDPCFKLWHCNGSQNKVSDKQFLFTFHETDRLTPTEINIFKNQAKVFVSSPYNQGIFQNFGINADYVPLGFDSTHFRRLEKRLVPSDIISFGCVAKFEKRKATREVIKYWAKKYGNNSKYFLQLAVSNPFLNEQQNLSLISEALEGRKYHNINILPFVQTSGGEYNQILNSIDILLGMSKSECWGLPEFHSTAMGHYNVLHRATGYLAWANEENSTFVESCGKENSADGMFFNQGSPFSQGDYYTWAEEDFLAACEVAEKKYLVNPINEAGLKLQEEFTWKKTTESILEKIF
jgi:hypothetical protein